MIMGPEFHVKFLIKETDSTIGNGEEEKSSTTKENEVKQHPHQRKKVWDTSPITEEKKYH